MELTTEMLQAHSFDIAGRSPENKAQVLALVEALNEKLVETQSPFWAVAAALTMLMDAVREKSEESMMAMMNQRVGQDNAAN